MWIIAPVIIIIGGCFFVVAMDWIGLCALQQTFIYARGFSTWDTLTL